MSRLAVGFLLRVEKLDMPPDTPSSMVFQYEVLDATYWKTSRMRELDEVSLSVVV